MSAGLFLSFAVRSSLDSGAPGVRLTQNVSDGFRVCLSGVLNNTVPAGRVCDLIP